MGGSQHPALARWHGCVSPGPAGALPRVTSPPSPQDALIDSIKKSKLHFVHCFLPKAAGGGGDPRGLPCRRVSGSELELPAEHCEAAGLMQLDVPLLRAQLRGSRLLDALRMYRQGEPPPSPKFVSDLTTHGRGRRGANPPSAARGPTGNPFGTRPRAEPGCCQLFPSRGGWPCSPRGAVVTSGLGAGDRHGLTWVSAPVLPGCWQRSRWQPALIPTGRGAPGRAQPSAGGCGRRARV